MTTGVLNRKKLDQIVIITAAAIVTPPFDIKCVWAIPSGQLADFMNANMASETLGVAGVNQNALPFEFQQGATPAVKYGAWAVVGLRQMITKADQPWSPATGYDTPAELIGNSDVSWPIDLTALATPTLGLNIDGGGAFDVDFTTSSPVATDGDLSKVVKALNTDVTFTAQAIAFAEGLGANRRLAIQTKSTSGGSVVITTPSAGDDVSTKFGFIVGQSDAGSVPTELFRFQDTPAALIVS